MFCISSLEDEYALTPMRTLIGKISYLLLSRDILGPKPIWRSASTGAKSTLIPLMRLALKAIPYLDFEVEQILIRSNLHDTTYEYNEKVHDPMPSIPLQKPLEKVLGHAHGMAPYYGCPAPPPPPPYRPQPPPVYRPRLRIIFSNRRRTARPSASANHLHLWLQIPGPDSCINASTIHPRLCGMYFGIGQWYSILLRLPAVT